MLAFNYLGKMGQLGNQMFQYAATRGIAAKKGYDFCIPHHNEIFDDGIGNKLRIELFNCFQLSNLKHVGVLHNGHAPMVQEKYYHFDQQLLDLCPDEISLVGYFQSEKWFSHIESSIRDDFKFVNEILEPCKEMINSLDNPLALHIRRGDFLINSARHHNLSLDYYSKALEKFESDKQVVIFTDDPKWCNEQKIFSDDRFLISEGSSNYVDMCLMSMCSGHIIANSSFSWWGAWLANSEKVVAPKKWFGEELKNNDTKDLYPESWEAI